MRVIEISTALRPLSEYAQDLGNDIIVLTANQKPVAALVSFAALGNVDEESLALSTSPEFMAIIESAREEFKAGKKLTLDEMKLATSKMD